MPLFGASKSRVSELEEKVDELQDDKQRLRSTTNRLDTHVSHLEDAVEDHRKVLRETAVDYDFESLPRVPNKTGVCEELEEDCKAWKETENATVKLVIPEGTRVVWPDKNAFGSRKLRAEKAVVADIVNTYDDTLIDKSQYDPSFEYIIGDTVTPDNGFDPRTDGPCHGGIHFYRKRLHL